MLWVRTGIEDAERAIPLAGRGPKEDIRHTEQKANRRQGGEAVVQ